MTHETESVAAHVPRPRGEGSEHGLRTGAEWLAF